METCIIACIKGLIFNVCMYELRSLEDKIGYLGWTHEYFRIDLWENHDNEMWYSHVNN